MRTDEQQCLLMIEDCVDSTGRSGVDDLRTRDCLMARADK